MRHPHPIRWLREHPRRADALLAVVVTAVALAAHEFDDNHEIDVNVLEPTWWTPLVVVLTTAPILWRRTRPLESGSVVVAAQCGALLAGIYGAPFLGPAIAVYSIGAHASGPRRTQVMLWITALVIGLFVAGWIDGQNLIGELVSTAVLLVTAYVLGDNMRRRRERADSLVERAERAEREQELLAQQRVTAERTRIARELHDVVAHSVSVMIIQAAAARRNLTASPERAERALSSIEDTGRQTMRELRGILGVLRETTDGADRAPQPTLADIATLLSQEDLPGQLVVEADVGELPPGVTLTAYRVVQEAITNVRRHAGPVEQVTVRAARTGNELTITVEDDGRGAAADPSDPGYGLLGMRERVQALGGEIEVGPRPGGGWRVRTTIPIGTDVAPDVAPDVVVDVASLARSGEPR